MIAKLETDWDDFYGSDGRGVFVSVATVDGLTWFVTVTAVGTPDAGTLDTDRGPYPTMEGAFHYGEHAARVWCAEHGVPVTEPTYTATEETRR